MSYRFIIDDDVITEITWSGEKEDRVIIPEGITGIELFDEESLEDVKELVLPSSLESIESPQCFDASIHAIYFNGTVEQWCAIPKGSEDVGGFMPLNYDLSFDLYFRDEETGEYWLADVLELRDVETIEKGAFYGCKSLQSVLIQNAFIDLCAFDHCQNLKTVYLLGNCTFDIDFEYDHPFGNNNNPEIFLSDECIDAMYREYGSVSGSYSSDFKLSATFTLLETGEDLWEVLSEIDEDDIGGDIPFSVLREKNTERDETLDYGYEEDFDDETDSEDEELDYGFHVTKGKRHENTDDENNLNED